MDKRPLPLPRFTVGMILGFGLVVAIGFGIFKSDRRPSGPAETPARSSIRLTAPASGTVFQAPADIAIEAEVEGSRNPVLVEFYHGPIKIGEAVGPPYRCLWKGIRYPGSYQINAKRVGGPDPDIESPTVWVTVEREPSAVEAGGSAADEPARR